MRPILFIIAIITLAACSNEWSEESKRSFIDQCQQYASMKGLADSTKMDYCYCLLDKYQENYKEEDRDNITPEFVNQSDSNCLIEAGYEPLRKGVIIEGGY